MKLSICVATLKERRAMLNRLLDILYPQTHKGVEILTLCDDRQEFAGIKRNRLIDMARGEYVVFIDDDDQVPNYYVEEILKAIESKPDAVGFWGDILLGTEHCRVHYSMTHKEWSTVGGVYNRPIQHLNPVRRKIIQDVPFPPKTIQEDAPQSFAMMPFINSEVFIDKTMYYYDPRHV